MKLRIQTLTGQMNEVEADPHNTILDLKVCITIISAKFLATNGDSICQTN